jgi:hypothetical protein
MASLRQLSASLFPYRRRLLAIAMAGLLVCVALIFLAPSKLGFALAGPLVLLPWGLMCLARSRYTLLSAFFLILVALGIAWPFIVVLG